MQCFHLPLPVMEGVMLHHYLVQQGVSDLEPYLGSRARVSEVLNRKRPLSLEMIRGLNKGLGIPAEVLIKPYRLRTAPAPRARATA
jgi:HTH-type transcriptional regulator/antitoxin HigA